MAAVRQLTLFPSWAVIRDAKGANWISWKDLDPGAMNVNTLSRSSGGFTMIVEPRVVSSSVTQ